MSEGEGLRGPARIALDDASGRAENPSPQRNALGARARRAVCGRRGAGSMGIRLHGRCFRLLALLLLLATTAPAGEDEAPPPQEAPPEATKEIRQALAMGADKAIHLKDPGGSRGPLGVARVLADAIRGRKFDAILFGRQSIDADNSAVGIIVARLLDLPVVSLVTKLELKDGKGIAHREAEGRQEAAPAAPAHGLRHGKEDGGAGKDGKNQCGRQEGQKMLGRRHGSTDSGQ